MAGYVLHLSEQENITLSAAVTRRLIDGGDGDAALLYLCLLKNRGSASPETLRAELKWDEARRSRAEAALARMGLVSAPKPEEPTPSPVPAPTAERPAYSREDVARKLEQDASFSALLREVERKLGPLSTPSVGKLLGLYEDLGLPADVLFLLVNHCIARHAAQYGAGRLPTMRRIEQEGYVWARKGLLSLTSANDYLNALHAREQKYPAYMAVLQLGERKPSPSEEKYLAAWVDMGFSDDAIRLAYERTLFQKQKLNWPYMNSILKRWHQAGLHTAAQVEAGDKPPAKQASPHKTGQVPGSFQPSAERIQKNADWLDQFLENQGKGG
mgnify:CR=1 FL=1